MADDESEKVVSAGLVREADSEDDEDLNMGNDGGSGDRTDNNTNDGTDNETGEWSKSNYLSRNI